MFKIKALKPLMDKVLTTADRFETTVYKDGFLSSEQTEGVIKPYQTVLAVPDSLTTFKVGDLILINPMNYSRPVHSSNQGSVTQKDSVEMEVRYPIIDVDGKECLFLTIRDIEAVIEGEEEADIIE